MRKTGVQTEENKHRLKHFQPVFISMSGVSKLFEAATPRFINSHGEFIVAQVLDLPLEKVWEKNRRPQVVQARSLLCY